MNRLKHFRQAANVGKVQLQRIANAVRSVLQLPERGTIAFLPSEASTRNRLRHLAGLWLLGTAALALVTWICYRLGLDFVTTAFAYLIVIVLLSLLDSLASSAIFSIVAVGCLNYFFVEPLFTFGIEYQKDLLALTAFLITSMTVTSLVRRVSRMTAVQRAQAQLLDLTTDAILVRDRNDVITHWNRGAELLYGWKREQALGKVTHELLKTESSLPVGEIEETLARTGHWDGELVHTSLDGTRHHVASRWSLQRDEQGVPVGTLESNTDITQRKRAEDALKRTQAAYLAEAQRLSHTGSFGWNLASGEVSWSDETYRIFEYDPSVQPSVAAVMARVHPDDVARVRQAIDRSSTDKLGFDIEHRLLMPDGRVKHMHVVAKPQSDERGQVQMSGAVMDVSERRSADDALRASEYRYRNMFQAMAAAFWELDFSGANDMVRNLVKSGITDLPAYFAANPAFVRDMMLRTRVVDVNEQTANLFGGGDRTAICDNVEPFWPEESTQVYAESYAAAAERRPNFSAECTLRRADGSTFDALFTVAFPQRELGRGNTMVGVIDVSARKQSERDLRASEQRYRYLFHHMPIPIWQLDSSLNYSP